MGHMSNRVYTSSNTSSQYNYKKTYKSTCKMLKRKRLTWTNMFLLPMLYNTFVNTQDQQVESFILFCNTYLSLTTNDSDV